MFKGSLDLCARETVGVFCGLDIGADCNENLLANTASVEAICRFGQAIRIRLKGANILPYTADGLERFGDNLPAGLLIGQSDGFNVIGARQHRLVQSLWESRGGDQKD